MNYFSESIIQPRVKDFFIHSLESKRLAHAYIFYGAEGRGKEAFALEMAKALNCIAEENRPCNSCPACTKINHFSHPDIKFVFPLSKQVTPERQIEIIKEKAQNPYAPIEVSGHKTISIDAIRSLKNEAKYASFEAGKRVFIIHGAEYFSREAANSFLKLLEEPPDNLYIFLITDDIGSLLDTIRSRCQPVYFPEFQDNEIITILKRQKMDLEDVQKHIRMSQRNIKQIMRTQYADNKTVQQQVYEYIRSVAAGNYFAVSGIVDQIGQKRDKNSVMEFLNLILLWFRDSMHFLILAQSSDFVNIDFEEKIKKFAEFYRHTEMEKIIGLVEQAHLHIRQNAHPALTLTNLAIEMKTILTQKKSMREAG